MFRCQLPIQCFETVSEKVQVDNHSGGGVCAGWKCDQNDFPFLLENVVKFLSWSVSILSGCEDSELFICRLASDFAIEPAADYSDLLKRPGGRVEAAQWMDG